MSIQKNDEFQLHIDGLTAEGSGVGHQGGLAVFVAGAVPQDTVQVHIIKSKKSYAIGKLIKIITPSPSRIPADCPLFPACGGCAYRTLRYDTECAEKKKRVEDAFARLAKIQLPCETILAPDAPDRYRNKAQYPIAEVNGEIQIGFYAPHSHRVIPCADCLLQPVEFAEICAIVRQFLTEFQLSAYNSETGRGLARHLYIRKGFASGEIAVCLVLNGQTLPHAEVLTDRLLAAVPAISSIVLNVNTDKTNVILGKTCRTLWGADTIADTLCGVDVQISPLSFYQVNHDMAERLYRKAAEFAELDGTQTVLDLYCGAGTIGLSVAHQVRALYGAEIVPEAIENAKANAARNHIENAEFFCGDAGDAAKKFAAMQLSPDVVFLDPPRKGCAAEVLETVAAMRPQKIVYVSCDPATLARDAALLNTLGYEAKRLAASDLFPRTVHVESVCQFLKRE